MAQGSRSRSGCLEGGRGARRGAAADRVADEATPLARASVALVLSCARGFARNPLPSRRGPIVEGETEERGGRHGISDANEGPRADTRLGGGARRHPDRGEGDRRSSAYRL